MFDADQETYFHCAPIPLGAGSIIEPGNWGRIIRLYTPNDGNSFAVAYRETVLEAHRSQHHDHKPSRLSCVFACPTVEIAHAYKAKWGRLNFIYEIEPVEAPNIHFGDYELALFQTGAPYFDQFPARAAQYWSDERTDHPEVLISTPVRILRRVD